MGSVILMGKKRREHFMKYKVDHDYHIHSQLSLCSADPEQNTKRILEIAENNGFNKICLTDHYWDETVSKEGDVGYFADTMYTVQNTEYIKQALPLPQSDKTKFYFGAEIDMDKYFRIGIGEKMLNELDFVVIPTTHLHMDGFTIDEKDKTREGRARLFVKRFEKLLEAKLPFHKIGLAHITCSLIAPSWEEHLKVIELIDDKTFSDLFSESAKIGLGIELNAEVAEYVYKDDKEGLRPYFIAKDAGCKFYLGSDAHHNDALLRTKEYFETIVNELDLDEESKFKPFG